ACDEGLGEGTTEHVVERVGGKGWRLGRRPVHCRAGQIAMLGQTAGALSIRPWLRHRG
ncbi:hypothetical protein HAX54_029622, partial [Datura stramonium]|nr:hypothetical protein [Datura stramonium]